MIDANDTKARRDRGAFAALLGMDAAIARDQGPRQLGSGMMQGQGMMPMMDMMQQMSRMMESCSAMMQAQAEQPKAAPPPATPQDQQ